MSLMNRAHEEKEESDLDKLDDEGISLPGDESDEEGAKDEGSVDSETEE